MKSLTILGRSEGETGTADGAREGGSAPLPVYGELPGEIGGTEMDAVYVHVPFCATKCDYCDFYSFAGHMDRAGGYLDALEREMELHGAFFGKPRPRTVFVGGGTPTLLPAKELARLMGLLRKHVAWEGVVEFTMEANPNTFDQEKAGIVVSGGVNRMSFGGQSFVKSELKTLQRDHDPESVAGAFEIARGAGIENLNVDLIFGIPGQTVESWQYSLGRALELGPTHMSCYSLTYEANTGMTARLKRGELARIDEEIELEMFEGVYRRLGEAGFTRYETSNYARGTGKEARECLHNVAYWQAGNWIGWGPSAGSHVKRRLAGGEGDAAAWQWKNVGSLAHYMERLVGGQARVPVVQMEGLSRRKWAAAAAVFWLRLAEGVEFAAFEVKTGVAIGGKLAEVLRPFAEMGLAEVSGEWARITERGVAVSDHVLARVLSALEG